MIVVCDAFTSTSHLYSAPKKLFEWPCTILQHSRCTDISEAIKRLEADRKVNAVVLKSTNPTILSAGLDFTELYKPNEQRLKTFWNSLQQVYLDLYGSRLAFVAAIEGHAPAGGCMIAMACDYRVMAASSGKHSGTIGLNEATFGLVAPPWMGQLMLRTIGFRKGEEALSLGTLFSPEQALEIGLVDKVVEKDLVLDTSHKIASTFAKIPPQARAASKLLARKQYLDELIKTRDMDTIHFCSFIQNDHVQKGLEAYLEKLKSK